MNRDEKMLVFRRAAALVHTSVADAESSLACTPAPREVLSAALDIIDGRKGEKTRRKLFERYLKKEERVR